MILIDGFHAGTGRGVGNYVDNILYQLNNSTIVSKKIVVIVRKSLLLDKSKYHNIKVISLPSIPFPLWENVVIPICCWLLRPSILHSPCNSGPLLPIFTKRFLTLHDVIFLHGKDKVLPPKSLYQRFGRMYLKFNVIILSRFYEKIFTVSDYSRKEIIDELSISPERVIRIYEGAGSDLKCFGAKPLKENTIIHFGSDDPRKNTLNTIKAFQKSKMSKNGFKLLVLGSFDNSFIMNEITPNINVKFMGFISKSNLIKLANSSFCLCYCSTYEGFGMPIIEFQEIGVPVLTSNSTSCAEVCSDGGLLVDPNNSDAISSALDTLYADTDLYRSIVAAGYKNIERFSWKKCALELIEFYEK